MLVVVAERLVVGSSGERRAHGRHIADRIVAPLAGEERRPAARVRNAEATEAQVGVVAGAVAVGAACHTRGSGVSRDPAYPAIADATCSRGAQTGEPVSGAVVAERLIVYVRLLICLIRKRVILLRLLPASAIQAMQPYLICLDRCRIANSNADFKHGRP